jgi:hypothetical protein
MATGRPRDLVKERQWRRWLEEQPSSGVSVRAFCRRRGLNESAFYQWRSRLAERAGQAAAEVSPFFVPVDVVPTSGDDRIEIVLAGGQRVLVPSGADPSLLAHVLAVLEGRSC